MSSRTQITSFIGRSITDRYTVAQRKRLRFATKQEIQARPGFKESDLKSMWVIDPVTKKMTKTGQGYEPKVHCWTRAGGPRGKYTTCAKKPKHTGSSGKTVYETQLRKGREERGNPGTPTTTRRTFGGGGRRLASHVRLEEPIRGNRNKKAMKQPTYKGVKPERKAVKNPNYVKTLPPKPTRAPPQRGRPTRAPPRRPQETVARPPPNRPAPERRTENISFPNTLTREFVTNYERGRLGFSATGALEEGDFRNIFNALKEGRRSVTVNRGSRQEQRVRAIITKMNNTLRQYRQRGGPPRAAAPRRFRDGYLAGYSFPGGVKANTFNTLEEALAKAETDRSKVGGITKLTRYGKIQYQTRKGTQLKASPKNEKSFLL